MIYISKRSCTHYVHRLVFFTTGGTSDIRKMNLDGSGHAVIITGLGWPHSIAIDYKENRVCWSDIREWSYLSDVAWTLHWKWLSDI